MVEIFDDIRKLYRFRDPCEELAAYVEFFSETSLEATHQHIKTGDFTVRLFPSYTPTIWLNLGSPYYLKNGGRLHWINEHTDILILRNEIVERRNRPTDNIFTIKFFPGGFEAVFGIGQTAIGKNTLDAGTVIPLSI
ncbi:MAG TPA: AraC family transcriptional regulator, partial [Chitinophagaceae bacterium]|nr:AraC family transcriptional regulator [Chitinophagaceae bacterium]